MGMLFFDREVLVDIIGNGPTSNSSGALHQTVWHTCAQGAEGVPAEGQGSVHETLPKQQSIGSSCATELSAAPGQCTRRQKQRAATPQETCCQQRSWRFRKEGMRMLSLLEYLLEFRLVPTSQIRFAPCSRKHKGCVVFAWRTESMQKQIDWRQSFFQASPVWT